MEAAPCVVCLGPFVDPVSLPCGHSFCALCAAALPRPECPVCRRRYDARTGVVPNFALRDAVQQDGGGASFGRGGPAAPMVAPGPSAPPAPAAPPADTSTAARRLEEALGLPPGLAKAVVEVSASSLGLRVVVLDNSGSTAAADGHVLRNGRLRGCTRWDEIKELGLNQASLSVAAGVPCELVVLNPPGGGAGHAAGRGALRVSTAADLAGVQPFLDSLGEPRGATPLASVLRSIRARLEADALSGKRLVLVVATDGEPTMPHSGVPTREARVETAAELRLLGLNYDASIVVRLCTDDERVGQFWNDLDAELEVPLDVLDDLVGEAKEVRQCGNTWFAYSPVLHGVRESGVPIRLLDVLDERALHEHEAVSLACLLCGGPELTPMSWSDNPKEFFERLGEKAHAAPAVLDAGRRLKPSPPLEVASLQRSTRPLHRVRTVVIALSVIILFFNFCRLCAMAAQRMGLA